MDVALQRLADAGVRCGLVDASEACAALDRFLSPDAADAADAAAGVRLALVTGPRRSGKTTACRAAFARNAVAFATFDDTSPRWSTLTYAKTSGGGLDALLQGGASRKAVFMDDAEDMATVCWLVDTARRAGVPVTIVAATEHTARFFQNARRIADCVVVMRYPCLELGLPRASAVVFGAGEEEKDACGKLALRAALVAAHGCLADAVVEYASVAAGLSAATPRFNRSFDLVTESAAAAMEDARVGTAGSFERVRCLIGGDPIRCLQLLHAGMGASRAPSVPSSAPSLPADRRRGAANQEAVRRYVEALRAFEAATLCGEACNGWMLPAAFCVAAVRADAITAPARQEVAPEVVLSKRRPQSATAGRKTSAPQARGASRRPAASGRGRAKKKGEDGRVQAEADAPVGGGAEVRADCGARGRAAGDREHPEHGGD